MYAHRFRRGNYVPSCMSPSGPGKHWHGLRTNLAIKWTESTWNPVTGCTKVSRGCQHCYEERMANGLKAMGQANYVNGFRLALHEHAISLALTWKKPRTVFIVSMDDKILRVARTIADFAGSEPIRAEHLSEAINYRMLDRSFWT